MVFQKLTADKIILDHYFYNIKLIIKKLFKGLRLLLFLCFRVNFHIILNLLIIKLKIIIFIDKA